MTAVLIETGQLLQIASPDGLGIDGDWLAPFDGFEANTTLVIKVQLLSGEQANDGQVPTPQTEFSQPGPERLSGWLAGRKVTAHVHSTHPPAIGVTHM